MKSQVVLQGLKINPITPTGKLRQNYLSLITVDLCKGDFKQYHYPNKGNFLQRN